jgi:hypothetical protein
LEYPNRTNDSDDSQKENEKRIFQLIFNDFCGSKNIELFCDSFKYPHKILSKNNRRNNEYSISFLQGLPLTIHISV